MILRLFIYIYYKVTYYFVKTIHNHRNSILEVTALQYNIELQMFKVLII